MTIRIPAAEAKAELLAVLDEVADGAEVEITRDGRVVARLTPAGGGSALWGKFVGVVSTTASDEELFSTGERWTAS